ncbi:hypothetical protein D3C81_1171270 [compost metagenome]
MNDHIFMFIQFAISGYHCVYDHMGIMHIDLRNIQQRERIILFHGTQESHFLQLSCEVKNNQIAIQSQGYKFRSVQPWAHITAG